jgi:hypothetical protein
LRAHQLSRENSKVQATKHDVKRTRCDNEVQQGQEQQNMTREEQGATLRAARHEKSKVQQQM